MFASICEHDFYSPWRSKNAMEVTGSAFVVDYQDKRWLVTNSHVVSNASFIQVRRFGCASKHSATVFFQSHECDLAVLDVHDAVFWENMSALGIQPELPELQSEVVCIGFPTGGDGVSTTRGVVSRIDQVDYVEGRLSRFLSIQIDAAINPGNSGGPTVNSKNQLIGVAFQGLNDADGIGYLIPSAVVIHFFSQIQRGVFGFPSLGVVTQSLDSPSLRQFLHMPQHLTGVLITRVHRCGCSEGSSLLFFFFFSFSFVFKGLLRNDDVILRVDAKVVACDGTVQLR